MKKFIGMSILMLITALLTFGCSGGGGGGGSAANPAGGGDDSNPPADAGYLVINFAVAQTPVTARSAAVSSTLPSPDMVRVVIRMISTVTGPVYDDEGNEIGTSTTTSTTYKKIVDVDVSTPGTTTIALPPGTGYIVDIISYQSGSHNVMLKYGNLPSIDIVSGETTAAALTLNPINATISAPASINFGSAYTVTIHDNIFPLRSDAKINLRVSNSTISDLYSYNSSSTSFLVTAPTITIGQSATQYFQGLFFIDDALLDPVNKPATDDWRYWTYYYPNPGFSDPEVKTTITPPGGFSIIITL